MSCGLILRLFLLTALGGASGCALWGRSAAMAIPTTEKPDKLIILADFDLPAAEVLRANVESLRTDLSSSLQMPMAEVPIQVNLYHDAAAYRNIVAQRYPQLTGRRAIFVTDASGAHIYALWTAHIVTDLRHELTHAYLHANVGRLPLWLDEGLAEYFEVLPQADRRNEEHLPVLSGALQNGGWRPNLDRLAALERPEAMTQLDYAEAWLWTHYLMSGSQRELITAKLTAESRKELIDPIPLQIRHETPNAELAATQYLTAISLPQD